MCVIKEFCCGCSLRHGAIIAAVLNAIAAVFMIGMGAQYLQMFQQMGEGIEPYHRNEIYMKILQISGWVILILGMISLVIFICLVVGITKSIAELVIPWLIGCMFNIVISCILTLALVIFGFFTSLVILLGVAFYIYLWIVVFNYYRELRAGPTVYIPDVKA